VSGLPQPAGILFDLDGTLVDTVGLRIAAWEEVFAAARIPTDRSFLAPLMGLDGRRLAREVATHAGQTLVDEDAERLDRQSGERFDRLNRDPRPLPGIVVLLEALDVSSVPWAVATSSRPDQVTISVRALGLKATPRIVDASHVIHAKPEPDLLLAGAEQLGVAPTDCWYVGDSPWDMLAARAAAMVGIGIPTGAVDADSLAAAGARVIHRTAAELHQDLVLRHVLPGD
jgi:HAD superfamily hydrolase (TIGR01509 family)